MQTNSVSSQVHREVTHRASLVRAGRFQIGLVLALLVVGALAWLARSIAYFPIDLEITRALQRIENPAVQQFFHAVSWVGFPPQSNIIFGSVILGLLVVRLWREAVCLFFAAAGSAGLWFLITPLIDRPRPSPDLVRVALELPTGGFPSGHALNLTAIFGFLIYLSLVLLSDVRWRALLISLLAVPILFIGMARVYDGAHWASDVLGGYLLGGIWLALSVQLYRWIGARIEARHRRHHEHGEGAEDARHGGYNRQHDGEISRPGNAPA